MEGRGGTFSPLLLSETGMIGEEAKMPHGKRTVHLEVDKSVIDKVEHGQDVKMQISGRINALESREVPDFDREKEGEETPYKTVHEIGLEIDQVKVDARNEFSDLVEEDED